ncbi:hypothetical protein PhCBS80983_g06354 [Powellomyces hirtus]|uniref:DUF5672 domain-containing protein n=1 Tax=Powellomyces hirtus TaxID=109895 RepID=A0A507DP38_9FUNG|nr:hypothetical protein PhCBS80983_g06354 [Powellomyces hirtus]
MTSSHPSPRGDTDDDPTLPLHYKPPRNSTSSGPDLSSLPNTICSSSSSNNTGVFRAGLSNAIRRKMSAAKDKRSALVRGCGPHRPTLLLLLLLLALLTLGYTYALTDMSALTTSRTPLSPPQPHPNALPSVPLNRTKVALLIELRPLRTLIPILLHYMATVPEDWPFHLMHSAENNHLLTQSTALQKYIKSGKLKTQQLPAEIQLRNGGDVSEFLTRRWVWNQLHQHAEHIFFFQLDAMICSNSDQSIDSFLIYDWIGAPWPHLPAIRGGNGGFSMRRKSRLLRCLDKQTWTRGQSPEDVWYSECLATFPDARMPTFEEGKLWAIEGSESDRYIGIHKPFAGVRVSTHFDFCPEAAMLFID